MWPTVAGYFLPSRPHDPQAPARPLESLSELGLVARLPIALQRHRAPCWHDAYPRLQRLVCTSLTSLGEISEKIV